MSSQVPPSGDTVTVDAETLAAGALAGVGAFVVGYLVTFVVVSQSVSQQFGDAVPSWKAVGWYFYNAHFVELSGTLEVGGASRVQTGSLIAASDSSTAQLLYFAPVLVLLVAGALVARRLGPFDAPLEGAKAGAFVVLGYLVLAVVGALVTVHTVTAEFLVEVSTTIQPQLGPAILVAGLVYPLVFGAIGGALVTILD